MRIDTTRRVVSIRCSRSSVPEVKQRPGNRCTHKEIASKGSVEGPCAEDAYPTRPSEAAPRKLAASGFPDSWSGSTWVVGPLAESSGRFPGPATEAQ